MPRQPGPNDFHFENGVMLPGLGADEPDDITKEQVLADAKANFEKEALLAKLALDLQANAEKLDERQEALDQKEAELVRRDRRIRELEAQLEAKA